MFRYELLYIIPTTLTDEEVGGVETKIHALFAKVGAIVESSRRLGKFRFTYPIKNQRHGHYMLHILSMEPQFVVKLDELLRLQINILRHLLLRVDDDSAEQKFDLIQFTEVNVDAERPRRREKVAEKSIKESELKSGVAAIEKTDEIVTEAVSETVVSPEELEKKIEQALSDDVLGM